MRKKILLCSSFLLVFLTRVFSEGSLLELQYLARVDAQGHYIEDPKVKPGSDMMVQVRYIRKGFSEEAQTVLHVEVYDPLGKLLLQDDLKRSSLEGVRRDRYRLAVPPDASGHYLIVFTIRVMNKDQVISEVSKNFPFEVA